MTPQAECCAATIPSRDEEHHTQRMMAKRVRIIAELIQTERDYVKDLELCVSQVVQPLRDKQVNMAWRLPQATRQSSHPSLTAPVGQWWLLCVWWWLEGGPFPPFGGIQALISLHTDKNTEKGKFRFCHLEDLCVHSWISVQLVIKCDEFSTVEEQSI